MQTSGTIATGAPEAPWNPQELKRRAAGWRSWVTPLISVAVLVAALGQMRTLDVRHVLAMVPVAPGFWLALAGAYLSLPVSEWLIYRGLWGLPFAGMVPLLRKRISNEILLGYSGELYFYAWMRRHGRAMSAMSAAPFGAIKDVAILSAQVGNVVTLAMLALAWPSLGALQLGMHGRGLLISCAAIVAMSLPAMLFRRRLFSLPGAELWRIALIHLARVATTLFLTALCWHEALPAVALSWWVVLAALRQLLSRLPLMPNKDIVFAGLAAYLIGPQDALVSMVAMTASLILLTHLLLGAALAVGDLLAPPQERQAEWLAEG